MSLADEYRTAISVDRNHLKSIRGLMLLRNEVPKDRSQMMPGTLGRDIVLLFEGMKYPASLSLNIASLVDAQDSLSIFYAMLEDKDQEDKNYMKDYAGGILMQSPADTTRTAAIKKWSHKVSYKNNPRSDGFKSASTNIVEFTNKNIELQYAFERKFGVDPGYRVLAFQSEGIDDWENVWKTYNKIVYGLGMSFPAVVIEEASRIGLNNKSVFKEMISLGEHYPAFTALRFIEMLVRV